MSIKVQIASRIDTDTYDIYICKTEQGHKLIALPVQLGWRELSEEDEGKPLQPFLRVNAEDANEFFTAMLLAARECGISFFEPVSNELRAVREAKNFAEKIVEKLLDIEKGRRT
jgi:hypothetical protein